MTLRNLLSAYDPGPVLRLRVYDQNYNCKTFKVCFNHPDDCIDDLEELDTIADNVIERWYHRPDAIIIVLRATFRKGFYDVVT